MIRRLLSYHLAFMMLLTNIGIPVFTHICHGQGKSYSSIIIPAKSCCSKSSDEKQVGLCHIPSTRSEGLSIEARPCCENHNGIARLQSDLILSGTGSMEKISEKFSLSPSSYIDLLVTSEYISSEEVTQTHGPPKRPHGRALLISHQVFRC